MKRLIFVFIGLIIPALSIAHDVEEQDNVSYKKVETIDFDSALDINAGLIKPNLKIVSEGDRPGFRSLIILRADFSAEMRQSTLEL